MMMLPVFASAAEALGEGGKYIMIIFAALATLLLPAIIFWVLVRAFKAAETGLFNALICSLLFLVAAAAAFYGEAFLTRFLDVPGDFFSAPASLYVRLGVVFVVAVLLFHFLMGVGVWKRSVLMALVLLVASYFFVRAVHSVLSRYDAYGVLY